MNKAPKKRIVKNVFDIVQLKKMIGKGLVTVWSGTTVDKKAVADDIKKIKEKILTKSVKTVALTGYVNKGVLYVFSGVDRLLGINAISYSEIKKAQIENEIEIVINQYTKITRAEIVALIGVC